MRIATVVIQNLLRLVAVIVIVLGILFWTGHSFNLVGWHMRLGETLAGLLILLAILGILARLHPALTIGSIAWAFLLVFFGMRMGGMMPGPAHEVIRVLHLVIGLTAIALVESLGARIRRRTARRASGETSAWQGRE